MEQLKNDVSRHLRSMQIKAIISTALVYHYDSAKIDQVPLAAEPKLQGGGVRPDSAPPHLIQKFQGVGFDLFRPLLPGYIQI